MARKFMTREVTKTTAKIAKMEMKDGTPVAVALPDEVFIGNITLEQAQRRVEKIHGQATVLEVHADTQVYEMPVEQFIQMATIKETEKEEN